MRKENLLQNYFKDTFSFIHKKRQNVLFGAVDSLMEGASLALSSLVLDDNYLNRLTTIRIAGLN